MELTDEQIAAVTCDDSTLLEACPGSGKTRVVIAKVLRCLDEVRDSTRRVAVITYTNAAVNEIESRLRVYSSSEDFERCEVSTIHAFCLNNVLNRFYWRIDGYASGFKLLVPDSKEHDEVLNEVCEVYGLSDKDRDGFGHLYRDSSGKAVVNGDASITSEIATYYWDKLRGMGLIDFSTLIYLSYHLLNVYPSIAYSLSCRFKWILVDEFQDTSDLQVQILKHIHDAGQSRFFLVGDPHQSIFGFAGARPELARSITDYMKGRTDLSLSMNWRSNPQIIAHAEKVQPRSVPMRSTGRIALDKTTPRYVRSATIFDAIQHEFLPALDALSIPLGRAAILAPTWYHLFPLGRRLRTSGVPIVGPGSRPYRRSNLFARIAEFLCAYLYRRDVQMIRKLQRELHRVILELTGIERWDLYHHSGRVSIFRMIAKGEELKREFDLAASWLIQAASAFEDILLQDGFILFSNRGCFTASAAAMCREIDKSDGVHMSTLTVDALGLFACTNESMHLITMHSSKGLEFDAVALVGLNEGQVPSYRATSVSEMEEQRRLFYVGVTRAKRLLLYVHDKSQSRFVPSRFLGRSMLDVI